MAGTTCCKDLYMMDRIPFLANAGRLRAGGASSPQEYCADKKCTRCAQDCTKTTSTGRVNAQHGPFEPEPMKPSPHLKVSSVNPPACLERDLFGEVGRVPRQKLEALSLSGVLRGLGRP